jgi:hypothetical protein
MSLSEYDNWEDAAKASKWKQAVSAEQTIEHEGKRVRAELVKKVGKDGFWTHAGFNVVPLRKATASEIDSIRRWKPWV